MLLEAAVAAPPFPVTSRPPSTGHRARLAPGALAGKPAAVICASTGSLGGVRAHEELRKMLRIAGARVVPNGVAVADAARAFDGSDHLRIGAVTEQLRGLLAALVAAVADEDVLARER